MKRNHIIILLVSAVLLISLIWYFSASPDTGVNVVAAKVETGKFVIDVTTTGELDARSSEKIMGPNQGRLRDARIWQLLIDDIVPDGTVVDSGDWVATLNRSDLENKIKDQELEVEKLQTQLLKTQLDTTMTLRSARDELINMKFAVEEKKIVVDQSIYEPPATQRQAQIDLEQTTRNYNQSVENYTLKYQKAKAEMKEVKANLQKAQNELDAFNELRNEFVVRAPKAGMVNYKKGWDGKKQGIGSQINTWDGVVATLPNLSAMNSITYVNEIDISKVAVGQKAEIEVDAFPGKKFTGEVVEVANMGEQLQNSNAKVFEVLIHVDGYDSILRPSMTTKNRIITEVLDSVNFLPIEAVNSNDSVTFVFTKNSRQQIIPGKSNESQIIILEGLNKGDEVYLIPPVGVDKWPLQTLPEAVIERYKAPIVAETENKQELKKGNQDSGTRIRPGGKEGRQGGKPSSQK
jgi:HlyD family secretion protein